MNVAACPAGLLHKKMERAHTKLWAPVNFSRRARVNDIVAKD